MAAKGLNWANRHSLTAALSSPHPNPHITGCVAGEAAPSLRGGLLWGLERLQQGGLKGWTMVEEQAFVLIRPDHRWTESKCCSADACRHDQVFRRHWAVEESRSLARLDLSDTTNQRHPLSVSAMQTRSEQVVGTWQQSRGHLARSSPSWAMLSSGSGRTRLGQTPNWYNLTSHLSDIQPCSFPFAFPGTPTRYSVFFTKYITSSGFRSLWNVCGEGAWQSSIGKEFQN